MTIRVVIVGAGLMGRWHARSAIRCGGQVIGVFDPDSEAAARLAAEVGGCSTAASGERFSSMLERERPDCVHVCTPLESHGELCLRAIDAGAHVLCEKPLTNTSSETREIMERAREGGRIVFPVHQLAFQNWLSRIDQVGEILDLSYEACSAGAEGRDGIAADAIVDEILPHPLSLFDRIQPGCITRAAFGCFRPRAGELRALGGAERLGLSISISMNGRPPRHELRVTGTKRTLVADLFHGFAWHEKGSVGRAYKVARPLVAATRWATAGAINLIVRGLRRESAYPGLRTLVAGLYDEIQGRSSDHAIFSDGHVHRVAQARDQLIATADSASNSS